MSKPDFVYVTFIQTTPEKVWNALFDKELTKLYWGVHKNVSDWKPQSKWEMRDYDTEQVKVSGQVVEIDPPKRLVLTHLSDDMLGRLATLGYTAASDGMIVEL